MRKRRRNADDALRAAERDYHQDPSKDNIARYWKACLRANKLPEPTLTQENYAGLAIELEHQFWTLSSFGGQSDASYYLPYRVMLRICKNEDRSWFAPFEHMYYPPFVVFPAGSSTSKYRYQTSAPAIKRVKTELKKLLEQEGY